MGAAYRSDESLALYFPPYVWKLLVGEHVAWSKDFSGVDAMAVNMISKYAKKWLFARLVLEPGPVSRSGGGGFRYPEYTLGVRV